MELSLDSLTKFSLAMDDDGWDPGWERALETIDCTCNFHSAQRIGF